MSFFWDLHQQRRIDEQESKLDKAERKNVSAESRVGRLEERLERLLLVNAALWELARGRLGLTEDDLIAKVSEIDLRDGAADGKRSAMPRACRHCKRVNAAVHAHCLYCGMSMGAAGRSAFDKV